MQCPECSGEMENKGNLNGIVLTSNPPQWDETWVCSACKLKKVVRVAGEPYIKSDFRDYRQVR
jgi:hypothetical protein